MWATKVPLPSAVPRRPRLNSEFSGPIQMITSAEGAKSDATTSMIAAARWREIEMTGSRSATTRSADQPVTLRSPSALAAMTSPSLGRAPCQARLGSRVGDEGAVSDRYSAVHPGGLAELRVLQAHSR